MAIYGLTRNQYLSRAFNFGIFVYWLINVYQNGNLLAGDGKTYKRRFVTGIYSSSCTGK